MPVTKWWGTHSDRTLFWMYVVFIIVAAIIKIGYFPGRVMHYDQSTSGPFIAHLWAHPQLYDGDVVSTLRPLGYISLVTLIEGIFFRQFGLDPLITSYAFTLAGNVAYVLALYAYARVFLNKTHAMIASLAAYTLRIDLWSLAVMGNLQVFPTASDLAVAAVILSFVSVLQSRWGTATALIVLAGLLHPSYALFATLPCALTAFFDTSAPWKRTFGRQIGFLLAALIIVAVPLTVMHLSETNPVSNDYFLPLLYGTTGHANAWLNTGPFYKNVALLAGCIIGYFLFSKPSPKFANPLFWSATGTSLLVCFIQWFGIAYQFSFVVPLALIAASRCSVYIAYLAFPVLYRGIIASVFDRAIAFNPYFGFLPHALLISVLIFTFLDCETVGKESRYPIYKEEIGISKWMLTTPEGTRFITAERAFQQDSFALRPAIFPRPYFLSTSYRIRDEKLIKFEQAMVQYWGPPKDHGRKWVEDYGNDIEFDKMEHMTEGQILSLNKMFSAKYFITRKTSAPLHWPVALKTENFFVYKIPNGSNQLAH